MDIFDKTIVDWAVHEEESGSYSRDLFDRTLKRQALAIYPERWGSLSVKQRKVLREVVLNPDKVE